MKGKGQAPATIWSHPAARLIRSLTIENNKSGADPLVCGWPPGQPAQGPKSASCSSAVPISVNQPKGLIHRTDHDGQGVLRSHCSNRGIEGFAAHGPIVV